MLMYKIIPSNICIKVQILNLKKKVKTNTKRQENVKEPCRRIKRPVQLNLTTKFIKSTCKESKGPDSKK